MNDDIQFGVPAALENPGLTPQQEFELLKARVPAIMKKRVLLASIFTALWPAVAAMIYFRDDANEYASLMIPILIGLTVLSIIILVLEIVNLRRLFDWYQAVNFFLWNIVSQISTMSARSQARRSGWKAVAAVWRFDPKDAINHTFDHIDAKRHADWSVGDYRDTQVIDKYLELRRTLEFVPPPTTR